MDTVRAIKIVVEGSFNSFRIPHQMRYQQTFSYPPKTTLIGMLGAAFGFEDYQLEELYDQIQVGILCEDIAGKTSDLWRLVKLKSGKVESSVHVRDLLYVPKYQIFFVSNTGRITTTDIKEKLSNPVYPLTLGRSDELVILRDIDDIELHPALQDSYYKQCVVPFNFKDVKHEFGKVDLQIFSFQPPKVTRVPVRFHYDKSRVRTVETIWCSFVYEIGLKFYDKTGWTDDKSNLFLF